MPKFLNPFEKPVYFEQALFLYKKYCKFLDDDYDQDKLNLADYFANLILRTTPFFWVITENDIVSGFVYLDNIIGNSSQLHSAELTTCFDKKFWGNYTKICAHIFIKHIFQKYNFIKIKALVYPQNFRVKNLLKFSGFEKEGILHGETIRNGQLQDIEIYSIFNERTK